MSEIPIILIGGGGHCHACIDVIEQTKVYRVAGIVEQPGKAESQKVMGYPVVGDDNALEQLRSKYAHALVTVGQIGTAKIRKTLFDTLTAMEFNLPAVISPMAYVSAHASVGMGTIVMHRAVINAGAVVGENCIINTASLIEHDTCIGDHSHVSTAAVINGDTVVGQGCFIGSNAVAAHGVTLPDAFFFKAGKRITGPQDGRPVEG